MDKMVTAILTDVNLRNQYIAEKLGLDNFIELEIQNFNPKVVPDAKVYAHYKHFKNFECAIDYFKVIKESNSNIYFEMDYEGLVYVVYNYVPVYLYSGTRRLKIIESYGINDFLPV